MNEIIEFLLDNYTIMCLIFGLGITTVMNKNLDEKTNRCFLLLIFLILALVIVDAVDFSLADSSTPTILRFVCAATGYTLRPASLAILIGILLRRKKSGAVLSYLRRSLYKQSYPSDVLV